jgi:hypothetical protein
MGSRIQKRLFVYCDDQAWWPFLCREVRAKLKRAKLVSAGASLAVP